MYTSSLVGMPFSDVYNIAVPFKLYNTKLCRALSFPKSVDDLRTLANQLQLLMEHHYYHIVLLYGMAYLYKQTFAIPGSVFMVSTLYMLNLVAYLEL